MTKDENNTLGKVEIRVAGLEITTKELHKDIKNLRDNELYHLNKRVGFLFWLMPIAVGIIAVLITLFGSLIILSG